MEVRYLFRLMRSVLDIKPVREWSFRPAVAFPGVILAAVLVFTAFRAPGVLGAFERRTPTDLLVLRAAEVRDAMTSVDHVYEAEIAPLERVLLTYRNDERLARRVATALVREGRRAGVKSDILLAVLLVENPWINPNARSPVGARGLMQIMPGHRGKWRACPNTLDDIESNICYGAQIYKDYLRQTGDVRKALLRYNGCVLGTNTPNCHEYPSIVLARAMKATQIARRPVHRPSVSD